MFNFSDHSNVIDKARRVAAKGESLKAVKILQNALREDNSDLPLILEIMHTYHAIDKLNEVIVWAEKGTALSLEAKKKVIGEVEDLFYGRGKPDRLAEYLIEKWAEKMDFEGVYDLFRDMSEESKVTFINREEQIVKNILDNKTEFNQRDFTHLYLFSITNEGRRSQETIRILKKILEKKPEDLQSITLELRRAERENYGDAYLKFGLGEFLLKDKHYSEAAAKLREAANISPELQEDVISILSPYGKESKEVLDYLSELLIESGKDEKALDLIGEFEVDDAIKKYQMMVKKDPGNPIIHKQLAEAYIKKERYSEGLREFLSAVSLVDDEEIGKRVKELEKKFPEEIDILFNTASVYSVLGWKEDVVALLEKAFELSPSSSTTILENLNQMFEGKEFPSAGLLLKARLLSKEGDTEAALQIYKEMSLDSEKTEQIKEELKKFKKENPVSTEGEIISLMLQIPEKPEEIAQKVNLIIGEEADYIPVMLTEFDNRVKAKPEFTEQFLKFYRNLDRKEFPPFTYPFALAELYRLAEEFDKAEKYYKEAIDEDPERFKFILTYLQGYREEPRVRKLISALYFHKGEYEKGCKEIENAAREFTDYVGEVTSFLIGEVKKRKDNEIISKSLTKILIQNDYYEEAIKWGSQVLESLELEEQPELMLSLAKANAKIGKLSNAAGLVRRAIGLDDSLSEQAIEILEEIKKEGNAEYETLMTLYKLYRETGNIDRAVSCLDETFRRKPSMVEVMREECEKLVDIAPIHAALRIFYGKVKLHRGDLSGIDEIEKGIRFDPKLKSAAVEALEKFEDPNVEKSIVILRADIEKDLGHADKALEYFIEAYWGNEEKRNDVIKEINGLLPKVELSTELVGNLLKIYANEERNAPLVGIVEDFFDGSKEKGEYLLKEIESLFNGKLPLPLRVMLVKIRYQVGDRQKSKIEMEELLNEYPEVAEKLKEFIDPGDVEMIPLLVRISLALSDWDTAINYIKEIEIKEQLSLYEQLLEKNSDKEEVVAEGAYLYFLSGNFEKAGFYLGKLKEPGSKEKVLLWFLGKKSKVSVKEIEEVKKQVLLDRIKITESPEGRAYLYIKVKDFDKAYEEIKNLDTEKREILLSVIQEETKDYWGAYQRLTRLETKDDFMERRALLAFYSGNTELALSLLSQTEMEPAKKNSYISMMLREATDEYRRIRPLIRR
jgi:tetratricopeptide (TPR) repeat protein